MASASVTEAIEHESLPGWNDLLIDTCHNDFDSEALERLHGAVENTIEALIDGFSAVNNVVSRAALNETEITPQEFSSISWMQGVVMDLIGSLRFLDGNVEFARRKQIAAPSAP